MKQCIKCEALKLAHEFRGKRRTCRICEIAYEQARSAERKSARAQMPILGADRENWHKPIGKWPWPPGTKVFEDVKLKERAA